MKKVLALAALSTLGLVACGADEEDFQKQAASFLKSSSVSDKLGFKIKDSSCEKPAKVEKGQTFSCTGTAEDGATYTFTVEITGDKSFLVTDVTPNGATSGTGVSGDTTPSEGSSVTSGT
ncbi:MAG: DUF4333 domain-containing protein [Ilumatobacteraceae bacterium]|jgi:hypothetical protein